MATTFIGICITKHFEYILKIDYDIEHSVINFLSPRTGKLAGFNYLKDKETLTIYGQRKISINDMDSCMKAAFTGIGIAQLPYFSVREHLLSGNLTRILTDQPTASLPVYIVYLQNRHLSANVRAFIDWVVELFAKERQLYSHQ